MRTALPYEVSVDCKPRTSTCRSSLITSILLSTACSDKQCNGAKEDRYFSEIELLSKA